jgi:hypothetical protein
MNIAQLLHFFLFAQNHKIVKPLLPYVSIIHGLPQTGWLGLVSRPQLAQYLAREPLLEYLHNSRHAASLRFADEKMNVLRHNHISDHDKLVTTSDLVKDFQQPVAAARLTEHRRAMIAAAGDEVEMSRIVFSS